MEAIAGMSRNRARSWAALLAVTFLAACENGGPVQPEAAAVQAPSSSTVAAQVNDLGTVPPSFDFNASRIVSLDGQVAGAPTSQGVVLQGDGSTLFTQTVSRFSTAPHYTPPSNGGGFSIYSWFNQDFGWKHDFPAWNTPGLTILSAKLVISAWDVDSEPYHGWDGEYDGISVDGVALNPGYLQGTNGAWSVTTFDVPVNAITDDGWVNVWINIDMHHSSQYWATTLDNSRLEITYRVGPVNHPPFQPVLSIAPAGAVPDDANLSVSVVGPVPPDPDGHAVTYTYRWFLDTGTGGFLDPEFHGRGSFNGPSVPASATRVNDTWRVQVTPVDQLGAIGPYATATFMKVTQVVNHPPIPVIQLNCPGPYNEGQPVCLNGGGTVDPDPGDDVSTLTFLWTYGDGTTYQQLGVVGQPNHVYADNGVYTVTLRVTDQKGAFAQTQTTVTVLNVAPQVATNHPPGVVYGQPFTVAGPFFDAGALDAPWQWSISFGNGSIATGSVNERGVISATTQYLQVGQFAVKVCVTDKDGGQGCKDSSVTVVDPTPPVISWRYEPAAPDGARGWYVSPVTVRWTVTDPESAIVGSTCTDRTQTADGGNLSFACEATSAGGTAKAVTAPFNLDQAAPEITFTGNAGAYDVTDLVGIACSATDATSGIHQATCPSLQKYGWELPAGESVLSASAMDVAGHTQSAEARFRVTASYAGLCSLVQLWVSNQGVANSLCAKINAANAAEARGNLSARDGSLGAFINEVEGQAGKKVPATKAPILIGWATTRMN